MDDDDDSIAFSPKPAGLYFNFPHFYLGEEIFVPRIYELNNQQESIPEGFNTVALTLDGTMKSVLDWREKSVLASYYISQGYHLFWKLNLGLFSELDWPLSDETQFKALSLALEHFTQDLWKNYAEHTIGVSVYEGPLDFSFRFPWDAQQEQNYHRWMQQQECSMLTAALSKALYCRNAIADYLDMLTINMPDRLQLFILIDGTDIEHPADLLQMAALDRFERFQIALQGSITASPYFSWRNDLMQLGYIGKNLPQQTSSMCKIGICPLPKEYMGVEEEFNTIFSDLNSKNIPYKIISENRLTIEWDGLDYLIYSSKGITAQGKRKLNGFIAAGGTVIACDNYASFSL